MDMCLSTLQNGSGWIELSRCTLHPIATVRSNLLIAVCPMRGHYLNLRYTTIGCSKLADRYLFWVGALPPLHAHLVQQFLQV